MHKIFDLREMDIEQLRTLAESLNIKGWKKMEKDDLVYDNKHPQLRAVHFKKEEKYNRYLLLKSLLKGARGE